ncbi:MAG: hypothetical protein C4331_08525 [Meiothermus sp.]
MSESNSSTARPPLALPDRWGLQAPFSAIHHVALITNDMKKTVAFYRDVLEVMVETQTGFILPDPAY